MRDLPTDRPAETATAAAPALELSIVVPAYNEAAKLPGTLAVLDAYLAARGGRGEVLVIDDGSSDGTGDVVVGHPSRSAVSCVRLEQNRGKGRAVVTGVAASRGRTVVFVDADQPYTLANLDHAVRLIEAGTADLALGGRDLAGSTFDQSYPLARHLAGRVYALLARAVLGLPFGDTQCGLKAFRGDVARALFPQLTIERFGFDVELVYLAYTRGHRIVRFPVTLSHRHESRVRLLRDSLKMFGDLWRVRANEARGLYGPRPAGARGTIVVDSGAAATPSRPRRAPGGAADP